MLSEGQRNDINFAIPVLEHINIEGSRVLADRGYDSQNLIDYIYEYGGEPTIPSKKGAKFERLAYAFLATVLSVGLPRITIL